MAKSPSPSVEPLRPFPLFAVSRKSRSAVISFIVQLVISTAITLLNTFNRQKIGSGSHRVLSRQGSPFSLLCPRPSLNLARENGVSYATAASGEYRCWRFGNSGIAADSAFNDRAIGQLSPIIITLICISYQRPCFSPFALCATLFICQSIDFPMEYRIR